MATSLAITLPGLTQGIEPPVHLDVYDGPLDLLLLLVRREGVSIREIPIARICDAYLAHLEAAGEDQINVDEAGDYLVLAATLCQLKARELLPRPQDVAIDSSEADLDPREALVRRLLEYERYREAGQALGRLECLDREVFARPATAPALDEQPLDPVLDAFGLLSLFYELSERHAEPEPVHRVEREVFRFGERAREVLAFLRDSEDLLLAELFLQVGSRASRTFTFLTVLEMARLGLVDLHQRMHLGAVRVLLKRDPGEGQLAALPDELG